MHLETKESQQETIKMEALPSFGVLITTEATLIRLRKILWHFEAKTYTYISYEDIDTQFSHF